MKVLITATGVRCVRVPETEEQINLRKEIRRFQSQRRKEFREEISEEISEIGEIPEVMRKKLLEASIKDGDCWIWTSDERVEYNGAMESVYKVSYIVFKLTELPENRPCICHKCDNKKCINPNHLYACSEKRLGLNEDVK